MILPAAAFLLLLLAILVWRAYRRSLRSGRDNQTAFLDALKADGRILLIFLALACLPALTALPVPYPLPLAVALAVLAVWAILAAVFWEEEVAPASLLHQPAPSLALPSYDAPPALPAWVLSLPALDGDVPRAFAWTFTESGGRPVEMAASVLLSTARYEAARAEERLPNHAWARYPAADTPELDTLAAEFYRLHAGRGWSTLEQARSVLTFIQKCIPYSRDEESTPLAEWPRYPLETLYDLTGDCEDSAILAAALIKRLGFETALLVYKDHVALGVGGAEGLPGEFITDPKTKIRYFYGETTAENWNIGEVPAKYRNIEPVYILPIVRAVEG